MNLEEKFNTLLQKSRDVRLLKDEKEQIKSHLLGFIAKNPVYDVQYIQKPETKKWETFFIGMPWAKTGNLYVRSSFAALMLIFLFGSGITFAAQNALPGDFLYQVKTGINEKVLAFTKFSEQSKVEYDIQLVGMRLEEIEKVSAKNKLDTKKTAEVKKLLNIHIKNVRARIKNIKTHQAKIGAEADLQLKASVDAHTKVFERLSDEKKEDADNLKKILQEVRQ